MVGRTHETGSRALLLMLREVLDPVVCKAIERASPVAIRRTATCADHVLVGTETYCRLPSGAIVERFSVTAKGERETVQAYL